MRDDLTIADRVAALDWLGIADALDGRGYATTPLLTGAECRTLIEGHDETPAAPAAGW